MWETIKNDPLLKTATIIILGVLGFGFAFNIMFGSSTGMGHGMNGGYMMPSHYQNGMGFGLGGILVFLVKLLMIVSVLGLIAAMTALAISYLNKSNIGMFKPEKDEKTADAAECSQCGTNVKPEWKCCPKCGSDIAESEDSNKNEGSGAVVKGKASGGGKNARSEKSSKKENPQSSETGKQESTNA